MTLIRIAVLLLLPGVCFAQAPATRYQGAAAYPAPEATAVWKSLGASYVRKALKENALERDPAWNARLDTVMRAVGAAAAALYPRYATITWRALLIEGFGHGAVAFPGGTVLVDTKFARELDMTDDELALVLAHEVAHVVADHPSEKLSFMAGKLGKVRAPDAGSALVAFFTQDAYAVAFQPTARMQEREADAIGATIFSRTDFNAQRALGLFDKLAKSDSGGIETATHDSAMARKRAVAQAMEAAGKQVRDALHSPKMDTR